MDDGYRNQDDQLETGEYGQHSQDLAQDVVQIGEGADEYGLYGVLPAVPLDKLGGQKGGDEPLIQVEQLDIGQRQGAGERAKEVGRIAELGSQSEIQEEEDEQPQGREQPERPRAPEQARFAAGDGPDGKGRDHGSSRTLSAADSRSIS